MKRRLSRLVSVVVVLCMAIALFTGFASAAQVSDDVQQELLSAIVAKGFSTDNTGKVYLVDAGRAGDVVTAKLPYKPVVSGRSVAVAVCAVDANGNAISSHGVRFVTGIYTGGILNATYQENGCRYFAMMPTQSIIEQGNVHQLETIATEVGNDIYDVYVEAKLIMSDDLSTFVVVNKTDEHLMNMRFTCFLENDVFTSDHHAELKGLTLEDPYDIYTLLEDESHVTDEGIVIRYKLNENSWLNWRYESAADLKAMLQTEVTMHCDALVSEEELLEGVNYNDEVWTYGCMEISYEVGGQKQQIPAVGVEIFLLPSVMDVIELGQSRPGYVPGRPGDSWVDKDKEEDENTWLDESDRKLPGVPSELNGKDHVAYVIGYEGDVVRPNNNITRAEVATIFFRLLQDNVRKANMTQENDFSDVNEGQWFNCAVSTMSAMGVLKGYPDGTFRPNAPITRAEFAAIAARFDGREADGLARFTDIRNHWGAKEISRAYQNCWVDGYPNGTFCPDQDITRAEAMTLVNRVLHRDPETKADLLPDMVVWNDNRDENAWYYLAVQEATNSHDYTGKSNGHESWTAMEAVPDWSALEK